MIIEISKEQLHTVYALRQQEVDQQTGRLQKRLLIFGDLQAAIGTAVRFAATRPACRITVPEEGELKWMDGDFTASIVPAKLHWKSIHAELLEDAEKGRREEGSGVA